MRGPLRSGSAGSDVSLHRDRSRCSPARADNAPGPPERRPHRRYWRTQQNVRTTSSNHLAQQESGNSVSRDTLDCSKRSATTRRCIAARSARKPRHSRWFARCDFGETLIPAVQRPQGIAGSARSLRVPRLRPRNVGRSRKRTRLSKATDYLVMRQCVTPPYVVELPAPNDASIAFRGSSVGDCSKEDG